MKKKFTFLIAALMLLTMMVLPGKAVGQAAVNTVLWSENFSGISAGTVPSGSITDSHTGTTVYGGATLTYSTSTNNASNTRTYNESSAGGTSPELLLKGGDPWTIAGIPTGGAVSLTLTYKCSNQYSQVSCSTSGTSCTVDSKASTISYTITTGDADKITVVFSTTQSNKNTRIDDIVLKVKTAGTVTTHKFYTAVSPANSGSVLAKDSGNNTISSGSDVAEEAILSVSATAETGYKFSHWSLPDGSDSEVDDENETPTDFMMGTNDVTLTANFATAYAVNISDAIEHGSVDADMATATAGEIVTITATPAEGYDFTSFTVTKASSETVAVTTDGTEGFFEMPADDVTVSATFTAKTTYAITTAVTPANSGTITAAANAWEGKTVNVSVSPAAGYVYKEIAITKTGDPGTTVSYTGNASDGFSFTMPAYAVTVTVTFRTAEIYALYSGTITEGDYVIYYSGKAIKNTVSSNRLDYSEVTPVSDQIVDPAASIVWHISQSGDYWKIYNANVEKYMASNGTDKQAALDTGNDTKSSWIVTGTSTYEFENVYKTNNYKYLRNNTTYGFACYQSSTGGALSLYKKTVNSTLAVATVANGTITATPAGGSAIAEDGSTTVSSGTTVTLSASGEGSYVLEAWDVYKTGDASTKVTVTSNTFTMPDYGVTVSASFRLPTTFTVQYSVNGSIVPGLTQSNIPEGNSVTLPTSGAVTVPSGYAFAGWTENAATGELISGSTYTPTDNTTLYLVFIKSGETLGYNKVTSLENITEGTYIIVNDNYCLPSVNTGSSNPPAKSNDYKVSSASSTSTYTSVPANTEWIFTGSNTAMTIKNSAGDYLYERDENNGLRVHSTSDTWAFELNTSAPCYAMKGANNSRYCATYTSDWRSYTTKNASNYNDGGKLYLYKKTPVYTLVKTISGPEDMTNIEKTYIITVANGGVLTLSGTNNANAAHLTIEDGGQLVTTSSDVQATFEKTIATSTNDDAHWYTISSPVTNTVSPADPGATITSVSNLVNNNVNYNLYRYVEDAAINQWESYNPDSHDDFVTLLNGYGYLYRNNGQPLTFTGKINVDDVDVPVTAASSNNGIKGFNLLGNPYSHDITLKHVKTDEDEYIYNCYILSGEGSWTAETLYDDETSIKPCQGFFVQADESATATISKNTQRGINANGDFIKFTVANNEYKDVAYAIFDKGQDLTKINHRNAKIQQIYIPKDGENFAVATMSDNIQSFNLNFKAMTMGQYTLGFKVKGEFNYLHVIDRMTGNDIDMLLEGEYSFIGSPQDNEARFIVRLGYLPNYDNNGEGIFAYQNGNNIIVSGEGELQIFDVMGRMVSTQNVSGTETISVNAQGVYIFRLVGTEIKTQKIVVK